MSSAWFQSWVLGPVAFESSAMAAGRGPWHHACVSMDRRTDRTSGRASAGLLVVIALVVVGAWLLRGRDGSVAPAGGTAPGVETPRSTPAPAPTPAPPRAADRGERHDLSADEARGGHTLARHVGRSDDDLRERLDSEGISTASTWSSREVAERTVARALRDNADRIDNWSSRRGNRPNLELDYRGNRGEPLGRCMRRGRESVDCFDAVVVLRWRGQDYYVLTSYPEPSR
jgi:Bacterial CdiA-CT RNAse A domain